MGELGKSFLASDVTYGNLNFPMIRSLRVLFHHLITLSTLKAPV